MNTEKGMVSVTVCVTVMVSWVAREGAASLKLEIVAEGVLMASDENIAGRAMLLGLEPAASVVAGTIVVRVITLSSVTVVAGRATAMTAWPARRMIGEIALVYILFKGFVCAGGM
jgi:hypothetical protein